MHKSGRCFVAVVEIETDRCVVCLAELDAVQSEADRQADVRWRRAGNKQSPDDVALQKIVSRETLLLTKFNKQQKLNTISSVGQYLLQRPHAALDIS